LKHENHKIGIIGCGWLGLPLGAHLAELGYAVNGSTTSESKLKHLDSKGIIPFVITLNENEITGHISGFLKDIDSLIINIPPGLRSDPHKNHVAELQLLISEIQTHHVKHVLYISSTSVFKDETHYPVITQSTSPNGTTAAAKQLITIENLLQNNSNFRTTILRFGGLIDNERHPAKHLSGKTQLKNGDAPVNLIHKDDCIGIIRRIIETNTWDHTFNAAYPNHPTKKDYYTAYCLQNNLPVPNYATDVISQGKFIDSSFLAQQLPYTFKKPI